MSITITITIDGVKVSDTTVPAQSITAVSSHISAPYTSISETTDAGGAPSEMELSGMLGLPSESIEQPTSVGESGYTDAGAAPSIPPR